MPQEIRVLKCYKCTMFQTDIVKKSKKWVCKMCGEKQSVMQEFGRGSGKECRLHAQKLNEEKCTQETLKDEAIVNNICDNELIVNNDCTETNGVITMPLTIENKWTKYVDVEEKNSEETHCEIAVEATTSESKSNTSARKPVKRLSTSTGSFSKTTKNKTVPSNPLINLSINKSTTTTPRTEYINISPTTYFDLETSQDFYTKQMVVDSFSHIEPANKKHSVQKSKIDADKNTNNSKWSEFIDESSNEEND